MALLKFRAKHGHTVLIPGAQIPGQRPVAVGQECDDLGNLKLSTKHFECDEFSVVGMRLKKLAARDGSLDAVDEYTARACGLPVPEPAKKEASK